MAPCPLNTTAGAVKKDVHVHVCVYSHPYVCVCAYTHTYEHNSAQIYRGVRHVLKSIFYLILNYYI